MCDPRGRRGLTGDTCKQPESTASQQGCTLAGCCGSTGRCPTAALFIQDEYPAKEEPEYPKSEKQPKKSTKKDDDEYDSYKEDEYKVRGAVYCGAVYAGSKLVAYVGPTKTQLIKAGNKWAGPGALL